MSFQDPETAASLTVDAKGLKEHLSKQKSITEPPAVPDGASVQSGPSELGEPKDETLVRVIMEPQFQLAMHTAFESNIGTNLLWLIEKDPIYEGVCFLNSEIIK